MSLHSLCKPRQSVFAADRRATVLNLDTFLKGQVNGPEFFEENYFTNGMLTLVDRVFRHLGGAAQVLRYSCSRRPWGAERRTA